MQYGTLIITSMTSLDNFLITKYIKRNKISVIKLLALGTMQIIKEYPQKYVENVIDIKCSFSGCIHMKLMLMP